MFDDFYTDKMEQEKGNKNILVVPFLFMVGLCVLAVHTSNFPITAGIPMVGPVLVVIWTMRALIVVCLAAMFFLGRIMLKKR